VQLVTEKERFNALKYGCCTDPERTYSNKEYASYAAYSQSSSAITSDTEDVAIDEYPTTTSLQNIAGNFRSPRPVSCTSNYTASCNETDSEVDTVLIDDNDFNDSVVDDLGDIELRSLAQSTACGRVVSTLWSLPYTPSSRGAFLRPSSTSTLSTSSSQLSPVQQKLALLPYSALDVIDARRQRNAEKAQHWRPGSAGSDWSEKSSDGRLNLR